MTAWLSVVGLGEDGLTGLSPAARSLVESAEVLVGGERHLALVPPSDAERLTWRRPLTETVADIATRAGKRVVVLVGEPIWVPAKPDQEAHEACRLQLEQQLNALTEEADRRCGQSTVEPAPLDRLGDARA